MNRCIPVVLVLILACGMAAPAGDCEHSISVTGKADEKAVPDAAYVTLYAQADGLLLADAVKKADKLVEEIRASIATETNIIRSLDVMDVALGEKMAEYWNSNQKQDLPRPEVARRIRLVCEPKPEAIYTLIDQAIRAGAFMQLPSRTTYSDDIRSVVVYGLEQSDTVVERLKKRAVDNAKVEAEELAALVGKKVGGVVSIGCSNTSTWGPLRVMGRKTDFPTEYIGTNPREIAVSHSLSASFELID